MAVAALLPPSKVHHFEDIGYRHDWYYQCPANAPDGQMQGSKTLEGSDTWFPEIEGGIGCRCECDGTRTRNYATYCLHRLRQPNTAKVMSSLAWFKTWFP